MNRNSTGFTLIELMITVAIIGILAATAIPAYQDYMVRSKMSEVILALAGCRTSIAEIYQSGGTPPGAGNWGCEGGTTRYVASLATDVDGKVSIAVRNINANVDTKVLTMVPMASPTIFADTTTDMGAGLYGWLCGGAGTTVDKRYLPSSCRGL
ncbi:MAG TPA: pilin [Burkholderiales bacterium]|jgi:type IV pilus assembly protein PilA